MISSGRVDGASSAVVAQRCESHFVSETNPRTEPARVRVTPKRNPTLNLSSKQTQRISSPKRAVPRRATTMDQMRVRIQAVDHMTM